MRSSVASPERPIMPRPGKIGRFRLRQLILGLACVLLVLVLNGCVTLPDPETSQSQAETSLGSLQFPQVETRDRSTSQTIGQTFISRRSGLNGLTLWVQASPEFNKNAFASISLSLYHEPQQNIPLLTKLHTVRADGSIQKIEFTLPAQRDPAGQAFYLSVQSGGGYIEILGRSDDVYPYGTAYLDRQPIQGDLAFETTYDYGFSAVWQDLNIWLRRAWLVMPLGLVLLLPGWLVLSISGLNRFFDPAERVACALALSLAAIPLVMLWTSWLNLHWNALRVGFILGGLAVLALLRGWRWLRRHRSGILRHPGLLLDGPSLALGLIFLAGLGVRLAMVRDLATPAWVDSVHHALITRLIQQAGAFPRSFEPFLAIHPSEYHPGFHASLAVFDWISRLDLSQALLVFGQVLNALIVYPVYLLANRLVRDRWAGVAAAFIPALLTPMPAYYSSWGRYPQLAGLLILPAGLAFFQIAKRERHTLAGILLAGIAAGGVFLVHYRVAAFLACLLMANLIFDSSWKRSARTQSIFHRMIQLALITAWAVLLVLPWLVPMLQQTLIPKLSSIAQQETRWFYDFSWRYLDTALGKQAMGLAALGLLWALISRTRLFFQLLTWTGLMFLLANLGALHLPGRVFVNNTSVTISLFLPIAVAGGFLASQLVEGLHRLGSTRFRWMPEAVALLAAISTGFWGAHQLLPILNPITELSRSADLAGIRWVQENIPADETVLITPFLWGYNTYAGDDGGAWIAPLAERVTLPPPVIYSLDNPSQARRINQACQQVLDQAEDPAALWEFLNEINVQYVFIGARAGALSPDLLQTSGLFITRYVRDGVWVFEASP